MNIKYIIGIMVIVAAGVMTGCGDSDGGGGIAANPNAPAAITMTASKVMALANGTDTVALQASVRKADGTAVADGTVVNFSANVATLAAPSAATTNGTASVNVTCAPIAGANNYTALVTAASGSVSGTKDVKFINQPTSADVSIGFNVAVTNLAALQFKVSNTAGATFNNGTQLISRVNNAAAAPTSIVQAGFDPLANALTIGLASTGGFNTGTTPIIKATFAVTAGSGLPVFTADTAPANFLATDPVSSPTNPQVTASNMVISTVFNTEL